MSWDVRPRRSSRASSGWPAAPEVTAFEAKTRFGELLERVANGEEVVITRHDRPVARLIPEGVPRLDEVRRGLPLRLDPDAASLAFSRLSELASDYRLTVYDAACLELAQRRQLVLGCKDGPLRSAAQQAGVRLWR